MAVEHILGHSASMRWIGDPTPFTARAGAQIGRRPLRALVVDDNDGNRQLLSAILRSQDLEVDIASCGETAVEAARQTAFDLILMDLNMPNMDGLTATRLIRQQESAQAGRRTKIVIVSSQGAASDMARSRAAGADQHITKPVDLAALIDLVERRQRAALVESCLRWLKGRLMAGARA
ncbi:response regulator [Phenylobacterium aquaticum]|uniref:response regulator n=1 Tax=Phenylobacterium aquaticum TaxID=1763816 RepID=UPI0026F240DB|nr:response regulator [Phenylobacterium aquaticum]